MRVYPFPDDQFTFEEFRTLTMTRIQLAESRTALYHCGRHYFRGILAASKPPCRLQGGLDTEFKICRHLARIHGRGDDGEMLRYISGGKLNYKSSILFCLWGMGWEWRVGSSNESYVSGTACGMTTPGNHIQFDPFSK